MKNRLHGDPARGITLPLPVGSGALIGVAIALGSAGLYGVPITDRATTTTINAGTAAPGLKHTEASVILPQIFMVIDALNDSGSTINQFAKVYVTSAGQYTGTASGNTFVGYNLGTNSAAGGNTANNGHMKLGLASHT